MPLARASCASIAFAAAASACIHARSHARGADNAASTVNDGASTAASCAGSIHESAITMCVAPDRLSHSLTTRDAGGSPMCTTVSG